MFTVPTVCAGTAWNTWKRLIASPWTFVPEDALKTPMSKMASISTLSTYITQQIANWNKNTA